MADSFFTELKRRNVFKVGVAYLVLAWIVIQVTQAAVPALNMPEWMNTVVFFIGIIGFPFAIFFAWAFEMTPEGIKKESDIAPEDSITSHTSRKLDFAIIGLLVVALGYFIYESRFQSESNDVVTEIASVEIEPTKEAAQEPEGSSIAVLPFVNMSSDKEQEYFSDGISEEILNLLAKIPKLHVTSRSSAFFYKGKDIKLSKVGEDLGVKNILEGSVRKSGTRIRITAQLIEAKTDKHLWSETYDRELTDIFAIQDEISIAIVAALKEKLGIRIVSSSSPQLEIPTDAHDEYLKGLSESNKYSAEGFEKALKHYDNAIALFSNYSQAWSGKAYASYFLAEGILGNIILEQAIAEAKAAAEKSLSLDSSNPEIYLVFGIIESSQGNKAKAKDFYLQAIALKPSYAQVYARLAKTVTNDIDLLQIYAKKAYELDPYNDNVTITYMSYLYQKGLFDETVNLAKKILERTSGKSPFAHALLVTINLDKGNYGRALYRYENILKLVQSPGFKFSLATLQRTLDFGEKARELFMGTEFENNAYYSDESPERLIESTRASFPRSDDDTQGAKERADAEFYAGNYKEAVKYYKMSVANESYLYIYSLRQVGDDTAIKLLAKKKEALAFQESLDKKNNELKIAGIKFAIARVENDADKSILHLGEILDNRGIIYLGPSIENHPYYTQLLTHKDWPKLNERNQQRINEEREIYFKLVAEEKDVTQ